MALKIQMRQVQNVADLVKNENVFFLETRSGEDAILFRFDGVAARSPSVYVGDRALSTDSVKVGLIGGANIVRVALPTSELRKNMEVVIEDPEGIGTINTRLIP